jgi:hypothetical protein
MKEIYKTLAEERDDRRFEKYRFEKKKCKQ